MTSRWILSLALCVSAKAFELDATHSNLDSLKAASSVIREDIRSYYGARGGVTSSDLCSSGGYTCCDITSDEACDIDSMQENESTLVFPGGETRCIYSTSTPYAFQVTV